MRGEPRSFAERLIATAAGIALVAVAIGFAIRIIVSVWVPLVVIVSTVAAVSALVWLARFRGRSW